MVSPQEVQKKINDNKKERDFKRLTEFIELVENEISNSKEWKESFTVYIHGAKMLKEDRSYITEYFTNEGWNVQNLDLSYVLEGDPWTPEETVCMIELSKL